MWSTGTVGVYRADGALVSLEFTAQTGHRSCPSSFTAMVRHRAACSLSGRHGLCEQVLYHGEIHSRVKDTSVVQDLVIFHVCGIAYIV